MSPDTRSIRFGVNLMGTGTGDQFRAQVQAVADSGADVVLVPDHLGLIGPMPALVAAAAQAPDLRIGNFVLNAPFYSPALLARDLATVDQLSGGRLEIGLGAGYVKAEFDAAGIPFGRPGQRVDHLEEVVDHLHVAFDDPAQAPPFVQSHPPIMVAGIGDRVLSLAARKADIVAFSNLPTDDVLADRVAHVRAEAGERFDALELNVIVFDLAVGREPDVTALRGANPDLDDAALRESVNILHGSAAEVADRINHLNETAGISYFTFIEPSAKDLDGLAEVIGLVRG
ncbi:MULTISPECIES: TIGR03621 family F420-dependent LLM class oxidoreductase [Gordonia]|nr:MULTISPECIES: TIGR03621 family F420-dependent LLM class oxidoreductase [Gordonia]NKY93862.1 TIGR03621 family F420-dependent LLM class oxidoreductase [Gordonia sputi]OBA39484.1 F420-dependent oxidoreductase [Gordonia sp. 852002-51296_SCH5728562-b]OBC03877.1 F420-dependent oxidoreductase [Gordonia sp. 852002-50395_SCH5434458]